MKKREIGSTADLSGQPGPTKQGLGQVSRMSDVEIRQRLALARPGISEIFFWEDWERYTQKVDRLEGEWSIQRGFSLVMVTKKPQGRHGLGQGVGSMLDDRPESERSGQMFGTGAQPAGEGALAEIFRVCDEAVALPKGWRLRPFRTVALLKERLAGQAGELVALRRRFRDLASVDEGYLLKERIHRSAVVAAEADAAEADGEV